jgi:hypothetical protein
MTPGNEMNCSMNMSRQAELARDEQHEWFFNMIT